MVCIASLLSFSISSLQAKRISVPEGEVHVFDEALGDRGIMEIYFPENHDPSKPVPGIIFFHGGSWRSGSLSAFRYAAHYLASRGIVAATSNYRLHKKEDKANGKNRYEITNSSARRAFRWFRGNAVELGIDPEKIIGGGGSAGAQSILGATLDTEIEDHPQDDTSIDLSVSAYVLFNPAGSISRENYPEKYDHTPFPPTIMFIGTADAAYRGSGLELREQTLKDGDSRMEIWWAPFQSHAFFNRKEWYDECLYLTDQFLESLGFLEGEPTIELPEGELRMSMNREGFEAPEAVRDNKVLVYRNYFHRESCKRIQKNLDETETMTVGEAVNKTLDFCKRCRPLRAK